MEQAFHIILGILVLIAAVIVGYVLIMRLRRGALEEDEAESAGLAFSLDELRKLRDAGTLDEEEYQTLRATAIAEAGFTPDAPGMAEAKRQAEELRRKRAQSPPQYGETDNGGEASDADAPPGTEQ